MIIINNRSTLVGGVLLTVKEAFIAIILVKFSVMFVHLETIFISFSVSEVKFDMGNVNRPPESNNGVFISEICNILNTTSTNFLNSIFRIMIDFSYNIFSINSKNRFIEFCLFFTSLPKIMRPTRVFSNSNTLIDNVWTNNIGAVQTVV